MGWGLGEEEVGEEPRYPGEANESDKGEDWAAASVSTIEFPREPDCQKRIRGEEWMLVDEHGFASIGPRM
ncbi:MAG: hypothetical protein ACJAXZ_004193 [Akkermansiaceae bacterium]|jgi:hypothetical protein